MNNPVIDCWVNVDWLKKNFQMIMNRSYKEGIKNQQT